MKTYPWIDEIEVSQKDAKCQLAEKWVEKTVTDSELQVSEDDTQIHIKGREFAYTIDRRTALFTEMKFAGREYLNHPMELNIWRHQQIMICTSSLNGRKPIMIKLIQELTRQRSCRESMV